MEKKFFIVFLILFAVSFTFSFLSNSEKINIPYFGGINKKVVFDITFKNGFDDVLINNKKVDSILKIDENHYNFENKTFANSNTITFSNPENIKKLIIYNDNQAIFYKNIEKSVQINSSKKNFEKAGIAFLSFFYNPHLYIVPYIILFLFASKIRIKLKDKFYLFLILILSLFLRAIQINSIPFWDDEIYTIVCTQGASFLNLFNDPGNPPLYFILFKLFRIVFYNEQFWRFSSVAIGVLFNFIFYVYLKKTASSKTAKVGGFIAIISLVLIYFSQELRCYMLLMLLSVVCSILLLNFRGKKQILYLISSIAILYTHFWGAFYIFYNFIFGCLKFKKNKLKNFIFINIVSFLSYIPLLIYKKESITSDFNSWLKIPDIIDYSLVFQTFSSKSMVFLLFVILTLIFYKFSKKKSEKLFIFYNFFSIVFVFFGAVVFSYLIKPVFCYRYFYVVYPQYLALIGLFASKKYKFSIIFNCLIVFIFALNSRINYQNLFCNHNLFVDFIKNDIDITKNNYVFMSDTVKNYKKFEEPLKNRAKIIYLPVNHGIGEINPQDYTNEQKNVSYVLNLYLKNDAIINKTELYKTPLGVYLKTEKK